MTPHLTETAVRRHLDDLLRACQENGTRPSVLALAARVGLGNTTFRRRYPEITNKIATHRRPPAHPPAAVGPSPYDTLAARNAKLPRSNRELTAQLKLAAAQIQYLAIRNDRLGRALENHSAVTRLDTWSRRP